MGAHLDARRRTLGQMGRPMTLRRQLTVSPQTYADLTVQGFDRAFQPQEIQGGVRQGDRRVEILNDELAAAGWPALRGQVLRLVIDGTTVTVVDAFPLYEGATLIGHSLWCRGG